METVTITLEPRKGEQITTTWGVHQVRPYPDLEGTGGSLRWRNGGGVFPEYGSPAKGIGNEYRAAAVGQGARIQDLDRFRTPRERGGIAVEIGAPSGYDGILTAQNARVLEEQRLVRQERREDLGVPISHRLGKGRLRGTNLFHEIGVGLAPDRSGGQKKRNYQGGHTSCSHRLLQSGCPTVVVPGPNSIVQHPGHHGHSGAGVATKYSIRNSQCPVKPYRLVG